MRGWLVVERQRAPSSEPREFRGLADARPPATRANCTHQTCTSASVFPSAASRSACFKPTRVFHAGWSLVGRTRCASSRISLTGMFSAGRGQRQGLDFSGTGRDLAEHVRLDKLVRHVMHNPTGQTNSIGEFLVVDRSPAAKAGHFGHDRQHPIGISRGNTSALRVAADTRAATQCLQRVGQDQAKENDQPGHVHPKQEQRYQTDGTVNR